MAYKIPDQSKLKNIGMGWGGEKMMKAFRKDSGVPKGLGNKAKKLEKSAKKQGF